MHDFTSHCACAVCVVCPLLLFLSVFSVAQLLYHFELDPTMKTFNGHTPAKLARAKGFLRAAAYLDWAEVDWRRRHPPRSDRLRNLFIDCSCSFCALLRAKGGNRDDKALAIVGVWREPQPPGPYTLRRDPHTAHLIRQADRVAHMTKKSAEENE